MRTVTNHAMMMHDHLCSPTKFVDNCSDIDFVAGARGRPFACVCVSVIEHKHEKSASLYVPLTSSLWVSAVSVCRSLPVCVSLSSLSVSVFLCLFLSLSRSVSQSVCLSVRLSVCLGLVRVAKKCLLVCVSVPSIPSLLTTTQPEEKAPWMAMDDHG